MVVYKYKLNAGDQVVKMPANPRILSVGAQGDDVVVWALVDKSLPVVGRRLYTAFTGEVHGALTHFGRHVGTVQMTNGIVVHVFDQDGG